MEKNSIFLNNKIPFQTSKNPKKSNLWRTHLFLADASRVQESKQIKEIFRTNEAEKGQKCELQENLNNIILEDEKQIKRQNQEACPLWVAERQQKWFGDFDNGVKTSGTYSMGSTTTHFCEVDNRIRCFSALATGYISHNIFLIKMATVNSLIMHVFSCETPTARGTAGAIWCLSKGGFTAVLLDGRSRTFLKRINSKIPLQV